MTYFSTKTKIRVRYGETDQMGVVYHGNYAQYFEIARIDWLEKLGFSYKKMEEDGVMLPVVALSTNFKRSAFFDDELTITTSLKNAPTAKIEFEYELHNQQGELLTTGSTVLVFVSMKTKRPIKCPERMLEKIESSVK
ncbi:acyl-CoA thioesterase [Aquimarina agarilytica]|uniref:acyl-CoA thioesterase n=1 Tax=Aquimarina agarilytica TaxID=1087449 RepID=UPI0002894E53|nr:thioesterase family protein [Aquimarina agarilytica]